MAEPKGPLAVRLRALVRWLEALGAAAALGMFRALPLDLASATGGWLCRRLGPLAPVSRYAERNLRRAFPDKTDAEIRRLLVAMWEHLGRVLGEYPHLARFRLYEPGSRVEVVGAEHVDRLRDDGKTGIFFSAHIGNWELASLGATQRGLPLARIYRAPNNALVDQLMRAARRSVEGELLPKGAEGARRAVAIMRAGGHLGMLVDQKLNDGIAVPFFGRPAMTAPALALLALKFDCPVVPAKVERLAGCRFRLTIYPPLTIERSGERERDVLALMARVNAIIEGWIRERPEQWLWLHRRWPD
jgi:Kdo2-lipid IVA lauroyltransferase/acyltransferase